MGEYWRAGERVLEVGSGSGRIYRLVTRWLPVHYEMCDISAAMAERCRAATGHTPAVYDIDGALPYDDGAFDWVLSFSVLLHVPPEGIRHAIAELARVSADWVFVSTFVDHGTSPLAPHCFRHDYEALFDEADLALCQTRYFTDEQQQQWLLCKGER